MPYEPLPSFFPITLKEAEEEEEVVAPPAMPYVPTAVPTPPPPSVYPRVIPPAPPFPSSPPLASPPPPVIPSPLPPSIPPAPTPPSSSSSTAPPVGEGGMEVPPSVEITDGQRLETEQLQDESSMDGVQQSGGQETGEQQTGEQKIGEQQTGEPQTGEQEMWGIRDGGRVLVSGTTTAPLRCSTRITRGVPSVRYAWAVVVEPAGLEVPPSMEITDGQRLETEQLQDESSMDGVQQSGGQETGEQQTGEQKIGEQQTGELQTGEQEMWGIRDGGRVLVSGTTTAPLRCSTRITRGVPPVRYAWAVVVEPAGLDDEEEDEEWTNLDPDGLAIVWQGSVRGPYDSNGLR
ncbi:unnamed protein product [Closterium sp. NIES-65]|nr:unnamed protein product [Closterium sp. NIES-65]